MTKKIILILTVLLVSVSAILADDLVMLRNGDEITCKISKISDKEVSFRPKSGKIIKQTGEEQTIPAEQVYMVKTDKRGIVFFIEGQRVMKESVKVDKSADVIYLIKGEEIPAWQLKLDTGILSYQKDKEKKRAMSNIGAIPVEDVFLVKYSDGSKDLFTELPDFHAVKQVETEKQNENAQLKVVFHNVEAGETLGAIAEKYGVEVEQIKEWNELPSAFNSGSKPKKGTQLMLQVKI